MEKTSRWLRVWGTVLFFWPFVLGLFAYILSFIFWCDIQMAGVVESVNCSIDSSFVEGAIALMINAHWFALITFMPSLAMIGLGTLLKPKVVEMVSNTNQFIQPKKPDLISRLAWGIIAVLGGFLVFQYVVSFLFRIFT